MKKSAIVIVATWMAFVAAVCLALPQPPNLGQVVIGAVIGAGLIVIGFFVASRCRPSSSRRLAERLKLTVAALALGMLVGFVLLAALSFLARFEPGLHTRFAERLAEPVWRPWALAFESSILEEVVFRLFAMTILVWIAARWLKRASFAIGLIGSALLFGLAHLPAWMSASHPTFILFTVVLLLNGIGGVLFGWIYWRWGLPYAILCHFAGDVVVQAVGPHLLA